MTSRPQRLPILALALLAVLTLPACGGGGGGGGGGSAQPTLTLTSNAAFDGYLGSTSIRNTAAHLSVGDEEAMAADRDFRSFVGFDLSAIPAGALIVSAVLRVYQAQVEGTPYTALGVIQVNHVDIGVGIDSNEFNVGTLSALGTLSTSPTIGFKQLDVTSALVTDLFAARTQTQFRLQFSSADQNNDGQNTVAYFESGDNSLGSGNLPQLVVTYTLP